jgi:hypothetical protein
MRLRIESKALKSLLGVQAYGVVGGRRFELLTSTMQIKRQTGISFI